MCTLRLAVEDCFRLMHACCCKLMQVTVVDAANFLRSIQDSDSSMKSDRQQRKPSDMANLLVEQVEFANVVVLNKMDLVTPEESIRLKAIVEMLNPGARVLEAQHSNVPVCEVLNTHR